MSSAGNLKFAMAASITAVKSDDEYTSYRQYLADYAGNDEEYHWLRTFLDTPGPFDSQTRVTIIDCMDGHLQEQGQFVADTDDFSQALSSRQPDSRTRLITVSYNTSWNVNKNIVDRLALLFKISPDFLRRHFYYHFIYTECSTGVSDLDQEEDIGERPSELPSQHMGREYHLASTRKYNMLSAYMHEESNTMLLWTRVDNRSLKPFTSKPPRVDFSQLPAATKVYTDTWAIYLEKLLSFSSDKIQIGNKDPIFFLYPYIVAVVIWFNTTHHKRYDTDRDEVFVDMGLHVKNLSATEQTLYQVIYDQGALRVFQREVDNMYAVLSTTEARSMFDKLRGDIKCLSQKFERSAQYFREAKSGALILAQFDEAQASTNAALSVGRLSKLAFVFIPLSFTSSVFGMNIIEFGQGTVPLRTFFITAAIISICTVVPLWRTLWRSIARSGIIDDTKIILCLVWRSPKLAFWYLSLSFRFEHSIVMALCGESVQEVLKIRNVVYYESITKADALRRMGRDYKHLSHLEVLRRRAYTIADGVQDFCTPGDAEK